MEMFEEWLMWSTIGGIGVLIVLAMMGGPDDD